ncbi:MAG: acetoacetate--CoA ligase [Candidatus Polarisedimenticolaceae bacterium]|nr:acetoacetate--CoA ligase [Candidatus Polarisedimenticolaceae bacterium]
MSRLLWTPNNRRIEHSKMQHFLNFINEKEGTHFASYNALYDWSINHISLFWGHLFNFTEIESSHPYHQVIDDPTKMPGAQWFTGAKLNFAENLLRYRDEQAAIIFKGEGTQLQQLSYHELYNQVAQLTHSMRGLGITVGDRVVGFLPNMPEAIIAMLATTSLGAVWSSCSPDFGKQGVLDRFGQIKPKLLFTADGYHFKGKPIDSLLLVSELVTEIPSIKRVVVVPYLNQSAKISSIDHAIFYCDFKSKKRDLTLKFAQLPFDHPLYIMYSSGTTGPPKCMVQSAGGVLLNQLKELLLHTDLQRNDTIFYYTTTGWMMWNWLTCALATGATLVLYDGNPFHPDPGSLWRLAEETGITVFGTSAGYLSALQASGYKPRKQVDLNQLRCILSTGSPLSEEGFEFVYRDIKSDLQLASISGGSDLNGCFALGNPMLPVYSGEIQCRGLGMKVEAFDETGQPVIGQQGELVCTAPFPSMPIHFWHDPDGSRYHHAYFDTYPNIWRHGDFIEINQRGGVIISGRSDTTLNPGGVRIGTADIYRYVEQLPEVADSIAVTQSWDDDNRIILFVELNKGVELTEKLVKKIKQHLRDHTSPRHIPAKILAVPEIPYTLNMKKVELAVKRTIHNQPVKNRDALRNPAALDAFQNRPELKEA